jgi:glucosyl-3-phosphoglycerate phosphatase
MDILLIRHGQSVANERGLLIANASDDLTELGVQQSRLLAHGIQKRVKEARWLYCSPWRRALTTAEIVLDERMPEALLDARLAETNPGRHGTWLEKDFNAQYPDFYQDLGRRYDGGESHREMAQRVCDWVQSEITPKQAQDGELIAIAHGGPITVILQFLLGVPMEERYPSFTVPNASYSHLRWRADLGRFCLITAGATPSP